MVYSQSYRDFCLGSLEVIVPRIQTCVNTEPFRLPVALPAYPAHLPPFSPPPDHSPFLGRPFWPAYFSAVTLPCQPLKPPPLCFSLPLCRASETSSPQVPLPAPLLLQPSLLSSFPPSSLWTCPGGTVSFGSLLVHPHCSVPPLPYLPPFRSFFLCETRFLYALYRLAGFLSAEGLLLPFSPPFGSPLAGLSFGLCL